MTSPHSSLHSSSSRSADSSSSGPAETLQEQTLRWIAEDPDPEDRACLQQMLEQGDVSELQARFAGPLAFGTAGLRGLIGAGPSRMNRAVVLRTTAGLASHLLATIPDAKSRGVVVGCDARRLSAQFRQDTANVLSAAGIPVFLFDDICATPLVAFAVKELGAAAGVMVTASHNPPEYNGYKVYASNGAQIIAPTDTQISLAIDAAPAANLVPQNSDLVQPIPQELIQKYIEAVGTFVNRMGGIRANRKDLVVAYTPLHGVGFAFAQRVFEHLGFTSFFSESSQSAPDGTFPTVTFPNPEEPGAMDRVTALARDIRADLVVANDPDADRLAISIPTGDGNYLPLTGNEIGIMLAHYLLTEGPAVNHPVVLNTIVSSPLLGRIAEAHGVTWEQTLTGFKWIANRAIQLEQAGATFVMGYEEALGYCLGSLVWDKDGLSAAAVFGELAASCKAHGESLRTRLENIYRRYGLVVSKQHNVTRKGASGAAEIAAEMDYFRNNPPTEIGGLRVTSVRDYGAATSPLPPSNVLTFELQGGSRITMRPSGTEPKIKYYVDLVVEVQASESFQAAQQLAGERLQQLATAFVATTVHRDGC